MTARLISSRMRSPDVFAAGVRTLVTIPEFSSLSFTVNTAFRGGSSAAVEPPTTLASEADRHIGASSHPGRSDGGTHDNRNHLRARHPPDEGALAGRE
jgi:hypothetical protein